MFVIDEVGFGTKPNKQYAYSKIGTPALRAQKLLSKNLTCIATISTRKVEFIRFIKGSGSKKEIFMDYLDQLIEAMKIKYPQNKLIFVLDNLGAHKTSLVWKVMQDEDTEMLFLPSRSPQFSPIENMFSKIKHQM